MLCNRCFLMLRCQEGRVWKGTWDNLSYNHHTSAKELRRSSENECRICRALWDELQSTLGRIDQYDEHEVSVTASLSQIPHPRIEHVFQLDFRLLYRSRQIGNRLKFVLRKSGGHYFLWDLKKMSSSLLMNPIGLGEPTFRTPLSDNTSSDETYHLISQWMSRCKCVQATRIPSWYPPRLIDIRGLNSRGDVEVKLVETRSWGDDSGNIRLDHKDVHYVTLSHCWGKNPQHQLKLSNLNIEKFKHGIKLKELPKTFRQSVEFAAKLPQVGYIWIDSLCIIQKGPEAAADWLENSGLMFRVYGESFLNISATAANGSNEGLFFDRSPSILLEDEILLNVDGLPETKNKHTQSSKHAHKKSHASLSRVSNPIRPLDVAHWILYHPLVLLQYLQQYLERFSKQDISRILKPFLNEDGVLILALTYIQRLICYLILSLKKLQHYVEQFSTKGPRWAPTDVLSPTNVSHQNPIDSSIPPKVLASHYGKSNLLRCTIQNLLFWSDCVDNAPVNKRGWVLQERLMAPRVLHFCRDQVAWECSEIEAAEGLPDGVLNFQFTLNGLVEESRFKGLDPTTHGKRLRQIRLQGSSDPDPHLQPQIFDFELWTRIVERYSRTAITMPSDKLIALSGMAEWMACRIGTKEVPEEYVAGMWRAHLASQLLWRIEPTFREADRTFDHPTTAPEQYRAPSFSWAAVDAHLGSGIVYGEVTDKDLLIKVEDVKITPISSINKYGMIKSGHVVLKGKLRKACLSREDRGRFSWQLVDREKLSDEKHANVFLDCPSRDADSIFGDASIYVLPAAKGERAMPEKSKYMICLLLQLIKDRGLSDGPVFRRIGLTKLSPWADSKAMHNMKILEVFESDVDMPHRGYDPKTGMHRIMII